MKATDYWLTNSNFLIIIHRLVFKGGGYRGSALSPSPGSVKSMVCMGDFGSQFIMSPPPHKRKKCKPTGRISDYALIIIHILQPDIVFL